MHRVRDTTVSELARGTIGEVDVRTRSALARVIGGKGAAIGVHRLRGPAQGEVGFAQRIEHEPVVWLELQRALELLLDAPGGLPAHRAAVPARPLGEGGAP